MEKRTKDRITKRLLVKCGTGDCDREGITGNISPRGIFLRSNSGYIPQTRIRVRMTLPNGQEVDLEGKVVWTKKAPTWVSQQAKSGMGIEVTPMGQGFITFSQVVETLRGEA